MLLFFAGNQAPSKSSTLNLLNPEETELPDGVEPPPKGCCGQYKAMVSNRSFNLIAISFGLGFGYFNGLFTVMNSLMSPLGYDGNQSKPPLLSPFPVSRC